MEYNLLHLATSDIVLHRQTREELVQILEQYIFISVIGNDGHKSWGITTKAPEGEPGIIYHQPCEFEIVEVIV